MKKENKEKLERYKDLCYLRESIEEAVKPYSETELALIKKFRDNSLEFETHPIIIGGNPCLKPSEDTERVAWEQLKELNGFPCRITVELIVVCNKFKNSMYQDECPDRTKFCNDCPLIVRPNNK